MSRPLAILRPAPGNAATAARVRGAGLVLLTIPLFEVTPLDWTPPDPARFDGLLLTSANAVRHGGAGLRDLLGLPVLAVGSATADIARQAGFDVVRIGTNDLTDLLADAAGFRHILWLAGRDRTAIDHPALAATLAVYASDPLPLAPADAAALRGSVALIHSARAGGQLARELARHGIAPAELRVAAISARAAEAAGSGWDAVAVAATPDDDALIAAARRLAIDP
ncbi:uroporphyrinogen-III synthase [Sphingomonas sp. BT-65]|uniref:uroporphyrinogen-III synthase n=1 Tax=Sphingomonas sp. BT-65 TaxID=2989821 RepID=UPI0022356C66|nr:uroporphyrinogen-III synthase [Sphingomonas sp. BT-65]MCW4462436.1 uroporphyrinogen-III synthase [Sphingomonas sp. BT-65]